MHTCIDKYLTYMYSYIFTFMHTYMLVVHVNMFYRNVFICVLHLCVFVNKDMCIYYMYYYNDKSYVISHIE